jgi:hypothetical protein
VRTVILAIVALGLLAVSGAAHGKQADITFSPPSVSVGDGYTVHGAGFTPGALVRVSALYETSYPSGDATVDDAGEFAIPFVALDLGNDTNGVRHGFQARGGPYFVLVPGEVLHIAYELRARGWVAAAYGTLEVE